MKANKQNITSFKDVAKNLVNKYNEVGAIKYKLSERRTSASSEYDRTRGYSQAIIDTLRESILPCLNESELTSLFEYEDTIYQKASEEENNYLCSAADDIRYLIANHLIKDHQDVNDVVKKLSKK